MTSDAQLLCDYAAAKSQDAFTELVRRHLNLVYSAALRQVRSPQLAEEISQSVFTDLARAADKLKPDAILTAWLYQVTRRTTIDVIRRESRRQARERLAVEMAAMNTATDWNHIAPLLEDAMEALDETDRAAILLRYFENKSLREVGQTLGTSDDAAQKRVSRAVERLREFFAKRGVTVGAGGLVVLISAHAVQAAPLALPATISYAAALAGASTAHASTALTATKAIAMTTLQKTLVTLTIVALAGTSLYKTRETSELIGQIKTFQEQQAPLIAQIQQLQHERDDAVSQLAAMAAENQQLSSGSNASELLSLRSEVGRLREKNHEVSSATNDNSKEPLVRSWLAREQKLRDLVAQHPDQSIPEFQLLSDNEWLKTAMNAKFDTEKDTRKLLAQLRSTAESDLASEMSSAIGKYAKDHFDAFPTDLSQLQPYFESPIDNAILQCWQIAPASTVPNVGVGDTIVTRKTPVDPEMDSQWAVGKNSYGSGSYPADLKTAITTLEPAIRAFSAANNGQGPTDPSQILPYLTTPEQQAAYQKVLNKTARTQ